MATTSKNTPTRGKLGTLILSAVGEVGFAALALASALLANSITLWTNAARVLLESTTCFLALYSAWQGRRVSLERYNYGLGKLENLASLFAGFVILATLILVGWNAVERWQEPVAPQGVGFGVGALGFALVWNLFMYLRFSRLKKNDASPVLDSQSVIYRNAVLATVISLVTVGLGLAFRGHAWAAYFDPVGAVLLCGFLLRAGASLTRRSLTQLLDAPLEEAAQLEIMGRLIRHYDSYRQLQRIRTRRSGPVVFIEVFLEFDPALPHGEVLARAERIRRDLEETIAGSEVAVVAR